MKFSERMGHSAPRCEIQIENIDQKLRAALWNCFYVHFLDSFKGPTQTDMILQTLESHRPHRHHALGNLQALFRALWSTLRKLPIDSLPNDYESAVSEIRSWFFSSQWFEVYDFIEFIAKSDSSSRQSEFIAFCNAEMEKELSGYRFVGSQIAPIIDQTEISEIEDAIETASKHDLEGVRLHITNALEKLSDRDNPDYRNSIKESISAVESVAQIISKSPNASLGDALKAIEAEIQLHPALKKGFLSIYGYTSDADGIRHALLDTPKCAFEDAKYMLVSCSAFVNYLLMKAVKAGIDLERHQ